MTEEFENCWFVYAASSQGDAAVVLTWCDDLALRFTDPGASLHVDDVLDYEDGKSRPHGKAGIFVWEGTYGYSNSFGTGVPEPECDEWFTGTIRKATPVECVSLVVKPTHLGLPRLVNIPGPPAYWISPETWDVYNCACYRHSYRFRWMLAVKVRYYASHGIFRPERMHIRRCHLCQKRWRLYIGDTGIAAA